MRIGNRYFRPGWIPSIATVAVVALTVSLGNWQAHRAGEKREIEKRTEEAQRGAALKVPSVPAEPAEFDRRRVNVRGSFISSATLFLDNQVLNGVVGYHVVTPLKIEDGDIHVLVNRGWIAAGDRRNLPRISTPESTQTIEGVAIAPARRVFELAPESEVGALRQHLVIERESALLRIRLQPFVITQTNGPQDGLSRAVPHFDAKVDMHWGYAFQWYSLAVLAAVFYLVLNFRKIDDDNARK